MPQTAEIVDESQVVDHEIEGRIALPDLKNEQLFIRLPAVPVLDEHWRAVEKDTGEKGEDGKPITEVIEEFCGADQLRVLCENSRRRAERGDYGLVRVGHIKLPKKTDEQHFDERKQPKIIGYIFPFYMGTFNREPAILGDVYIKKEHAEDIEQFPRRSPEIYHKNEPDGYIDALALLNQPPERDLGFVTYSKNHGWIANCGTRRKEFQNFQSKPGLALYFSDDTTGDVDMPMSPEEKQEICDSICEKMYGFFEKMAEREPGGGEVSGQPSGEHMAASGEPSGMPSGEPSGHPGGEVSGEKNEFGNERYEPSGEHHEPSGPSGGHFLDKTKPKHGKHEGMESHASAGGFPSATSTSTPSTSSMKGHEKREEKLEHYSSNANPDRVRDVEHKFELFAKQMGEKVTGYESRIRSLEASDRSKSADLTRARREKVLIGLAQEGIRFDLAKHLEICCKQDEAAFDSHVDMMRSDFQRSTINQPWIPLARDETFGPMTEPGKMKNGLTEAEVQGRAVELYAKEKGINVSDGRGAEAVMAYLNDPEARAKYRR